MKILAASDLHGSTRGAARLWELEPLTGADLVTLSGDITHFGLAAGLEPLLAPLRGEILAVTGNCDPLEVSNALSSVPRVTPLNGNIVKRGGWHFCGYSYQDLPPQETLPIVPRERLVLVSHVPARGFNDAAAAGHVGDAALLEWVLENRPALVLSGHIHESRGVVSDGRTVFVNPGPARDGMAALIELDDTSVTGAWLL